MLPYFDGKFWRRDFKVGPWHFSQILGPYQTRVWSHEVEQLRAAGARIIDLELYHY